MTPQEAFAKVYTSLRDRGFTRAGETVDGLFRCRYRSPVGPCAAGFFIPDEEYRPEMEGRPITILEREGLLKSMSPELVKSLYRMQIIHDAALSPEEMQQDYEKFASQHNFPLPTEGVLSYPNFQRLLAMRGFTSSPLSETEYYAAVVAGRSYDAIHGIACDVNAGIDFASALTLNEWSPE